MFTIQAEQVNTFEQEAAATFRKELRTILLFWSPRQRSMAAAELNGLLERTVADARNFGFVTKREIIHFASIVFEHGEKFYGKSRYYGTEALLRDPGQSTLERLRSAERYADSKTLDSPDANRIAALDAAVAELARILPTADNGQTVMHGTDVDPILGRVVNNLQAERDLLANRALLSEQAAKRRMADIKQERQELNSKLPTSHLMAGDPCIPYMQKPLAANKEEKLANETEEVQVPVHATQVAQPAKVPVPQFASEHPFAYQYLKAIGSEPRHRS